MECIQNALTLNVKGEFPATFQDLLRVSADSGVLKKEAR